jgi:hypothetical protein
MLYTESKEGRTWEESEEEEELWEDTDKWRGMIVRQTT